VPDPAAVLAEMVRLARPGGWVAVLEPDVEGARCYPPLPAFERLTELFAIAFARNGADLIIGRRLSSLLCQAGLRQVGMQAGAAVNPLGHTRRTVRADLVRSIRPQILELGLADERELDELDAEVRRHFDDPETVVMPHLYFAAWGRRSAAG
jgi:hypothetical protein